MNKKQEALILVELFKALLEIDNLKPFVSEKQIDAANRIKTHIGNINTIMGKMIKK